MSYRALFASSAIAGAIILSFHYFDLMLRKYLEDLDDYDDYDDYYD